MPADTPMVRRKPLYGAGYEYTTDPDGLERMRQSLLETPDWHDRAPINCNSLARLLDTIELLSASPAIEEDHGSFRPSASIPTENADKPAGQWDEVEAEVLAVLQPIVELQARAASERLYDELLTATQGYLAENLRWNIASRLEAAERGRQAERERAEAAQKRAQVFEDFTRRLGRLITSAEWKGNGRTVNPTEEVAAIDRLILNARATILKATPAPSSESDQ